MKMREGATGLAGSGEHHQRPPRKCIVSKEQPSRIARVQTFSSSDANRTTAAASATQAKLADDGLVPCHLDVLQVLQQTTTASNKLQQSAPGRMVMLVGTEVIRQVADTVSEDRDLNFG